MILLFIGGMILTQYYTRSHPIKPSFQFYFEPAVMLTCDKGFSSTAGHAGSALNDFLNLRRQTFSCRDLAPQLTLRSDLQTRGWYYTMIATSILWRFTGVSWPAINIMIGIMCGIVCCGWYRLYRFGMNPLLALIGVIISAMLPQHLESLLSLRDYSKAPFIIIGMIMLTTWVTRPLKTTTLLLSVMLYGALIGVGYGFRPDVLIMLPPAILTLLFFLPPLPSMLVFSWQRCGRNGIFCGILLLSFLVLAAPMLRYYQQSTSSGNCLWHFPLMGLTTASTHELTIQPSVYFLNYLKIDEGVYLQVAAYAEHILHQPPPQACTKQYDIIAKHLYFQILRTLPADVIWRIYKASLQIVPWPLLILTIIIFMGIATLQLRIGLWLFLGLLYFLGYPSLYFQPRHYFHLIFWLWWPLGFCLNQLIHYYTTNQPLVLTPRHKVVKPVVLLLLGITLAVSLLTAARHYQSQQLQQIIRSYRQAPTLPLPHVIVHNAQTIHAEPIAFLKFNWLQTQLPIASDPQQAKVVSKMIHLEFAADHCLMQQFPVFFDYQSTSSWLNFKSLIPVTLHNNPEHTHIYMPLYFVAGNTSPMAKEVPNASTQAIVTPSGIKLPEAAVGCIVAINEVITQPLHGLWLGLQLPPDWQQFALYEH